MRRRYALGTLTLALVCVAGLLLWGPVATHVRAVKLLLGFQGGAAPSDVVVVERELAGLRARGYGDRHDRPLLLLHGVHPDGMDEPRLRSFASQLAERGFHVVTPELASFAALRFDPDEVGRVVAAAEALAAERGATSIGVVGVSIGGGVAIRASTQTSSMHAIWAIGAHYDITELLGPWTRSHDERYGALALAHAFGPEYFEAPDADAAARAIRQRLMGEPTPSLSELAEQELAWLEADPMPPAAVARLGSILARHGDELAALSPAGAVGRVDADVFLLHGDHDPLIPASESVWIAAGLPQGARSFVQTPLLRHAEGAPEVGWWEQWRVVRHTADALSAL